MELLNKPRAYKRKYTVLLLSYVYCCTTCDRETLDVSTGNLIFELVLYCFIIILVYTVVIFNSFSRLVSVY